MQTIPGYSKKGRKLSAWIFLPLSALFITMIALYAPSKLPGAAVMGSLSLLLLTPLWFVFYPALFAAFAVTDLLMGNVFQAVLSAVMAIVISIAVRN